VARAQVTGFLGPGASGAISPSIQINTGATWTNWSVGLLTCQKIQFRFVSSASMGLFVVTDFDCWLDKAAVIETNSFDVTDTGTWRTFTNIFYSAPLLQVSTQSAGGALRIGAAATISATGFVGYVYDAAGTAVSGTLVYTASSREGG